MIISFGKKFINKKFIIGFIFVLAISGFLVKTFVLSKSNAQISAIVTKEDIEQELTLSGKIDAEEHAVLQFQTGGLLTWVGVKKGNTVQKFQTIASLDQRQVKKNLEKYLNTYSKERNDFDETKDDYKNSAITDEIKRIYNSAQADLNNSVIDVELQDLSMKLANISTPIEGLVTRVDTPNAGVNIYLPSQAQFEIVNPQTIYFNVTADQTDVVKLKEEEIGHIILDSYPEERISGTIENISFTPKAGESETVYEVKILLQNIDNSNYRYRLGMTGDITFTTSKRFKVLNLPINYVKSDNKGKYVLLGKDKEKTYVKTGIETDSNIEIISGLNENDIVYD